MREELAEYAHDDAWAHWMKYMFSCGTTNEDGTWTMPADRAERWKRQMNTPYSELSEKEKESDLEQADKIIEIFNNN